MIYFFSAGVSNMSRHWGKSHDSHINANSLCLSVFVRVTGFTPLPFDSMCDFTRGV